MTMAVLTFVASFLLLPAGDWTRRRISRHRDNIFGMTRRTNAWVKLGISVGSAVFVVLPQVVTSVRTVGTAFFPEDDRAEFIMAPNTARIESSTRDSRLKRPRARARTRSQHLRRWATAGRAVWTRATLRPHGSEEQTQAIG